MKAFQKIGSFALAVLAVLAAGLSQACASEIDLKVPDLGVGYEIFGLSMTGSQILLYGLVICVLGVCFGLGDFWYGH